MIKKYPTGVFPIEGYLFQFQLEDLFRKFTANHADIHWDFAADQEYPNEEFFLDYKAFLTRDIPRLKAMFSSGLTGCILDSDVFEQIERCDLDDIPYGIRVMDGSTTLFTISDPEVNY